MLEESWGSDLGEWSGDEGHRQNNSRFLEGKKRLGIHGAGGTPEHSRGGRH